MFDSTLSGVGETGRFVSISRAVFHKLKASAGKDRRATDVKGSSERRRYLLEVIQMLGKIVTLAAVAAGGVMLSKKMKKNRDSGTSTIEDSIEVNVPISTAYNQWTQFEDFPKFMKGVCEVRQLDDTHVHWRAEIGGKEEQWDAEITEQIPDTRIAWRSTSGAKNEGVVKFYKISDSVTRIVLQMDYGPRGLVEEIGDALGIVKMRASGDLKRFKEFIESRGKESGEWRGSVPQH